MFVGSLPFNYGLVARGGRIGRGHLYSDADGFKTRLGELSLSRHCNWKTERGGRQPKFAQIFRLQACEATEVETPEDVALSAERLQSLALSADPPGSTSAIAPTWVVWFRKDLRVHDHPGLTRLRDYFTAWQTEQHSRPSTEAAANAAPRIAFVYIFDSADLESYTADMRSYLQESVMALRESIRLYTGGRGDLLVMHGSAPREMAVLCGRFANVRVLVEDDWCESSQHCFRECNQLGITLDFWKPISLYRDDGISKGTTVKFSENELDHFTFFKHHLVADRVRKTVPDDFLELCQNIQNAGVNVFESGYELETTTAGEQPQYISWFPLDHADYEFVERLRKDDRQCESMPSGTGGETVAIERLKEYFCDTNHGRERDFLRSFSYALHFGCLSPRRILEELYAVRSKKRWRMTPLMEAPTWREARAFVRSLSWHLFLAQHDRGRGRPWHYWRWNGVPVRYSERAPSTAEAPAVLFIHGFGASIEHWERNASCLTEQGYHVYCLDLIGFGRSAKPVTRYTQELWERQVRDFVLQIVRRPVYIVGNSIGAYISLAFAADHISKSSRNTDSTVIRTLCKGVVLINPAGPLEDLVSGLSAPRRSGFRQFLSAPFLSRLAGEVLLRYLQRRIRNTLLKVYPVSPQAALRMEQIIYRHSVDPGAASVIASGFRLPPSRAIPELLKSLYPVPVLLVQGILDPLNDARLRAERIARARPDIRVVCLDAGHCPHDEMPDEVNMALVDWLRSCEHPGEASGRVSRLPASFNG
ncbi:hypothetical protein CCYA_CCYA01G0255 [Cyanidiococcus yangmingshanensis]|nr:hypothetical protein CCYA_CCYA01G0255 [Cyanidiococcus yangmingshanensis]